MVDYPRLVENSWCYVFAVMNIAHVGHCLAQLVRAVRRHSLKPDIHVVGFSLGAQVANYIARSIGEPKIDRITGVYTLQSLCIQYMFVNQYAKYE